MPLSDDFTEDSLNVYDKMRRVQAEALMAVLSFAINFIVRPNYGTSQIHKNGRWRLSRTHKKTQTRNIRIITHKTNKFSDNNKRTNNKNNNNE